jgi:hypothetical protein
MSPFRRDGIVTTLDTSASEHVLFFTPSPHARDTYPLQSTPREHDSSARASMSPARCPEAMKLL